VKCSKGHACTSYQGHKPASYAAANAVSDVAYNCDVCGVANQSMHTNYYHCDTCDNYDVCADCLWKTPPALISAFWLDLFAAAGIQSMHTSDPIFMQSLIGSIVNYLNKVKIRFTATISVGKPWLPAEVLFALPDDKPKLIQHLKNELAGYVLSTKPK